MFKSCFRYFNGMKSVPKQNLNNTSSYLPFPKVLRSGNTSIISLQLVAQHNLQSFVARITTLASNLSRNKFQCCKLQQHVARSRTRFCFWQQILMLLAGVVIRATKLCNLHTQCCTTSCKEMLPVLPDLYYRPAERG